MKKIKPQIIQIGIDSESNNPPISTKYSQKRDDQTYAIIGAAMTVHRELGCGFLEAVYQDALDIEFTLQHIPFKREYAIPIRYKGYILNPTFRTDFLCYESVIVELKALHELGGTEESKIINYLKGTGIERGLLINFGKPRLEYRRYVY